MSSRNDFRLCPNREHKRQANRAAASLMLIPEPLDPQQAAWLPQVFRSLNFLQLPFQSPMLAHYLHLQCCCYLPAVRTSPKCPLTLPEAENELMIPGRCSEASQEPAAPCLPNRTESAKNKRKHGPLRTPLAAPSTAPPLPATHPHTPAATRLLIYRRTKQNHTFYLKVPHQ